MITFVGLMKQREYLLTDEWIKKMWYIYTMEYYSATEKNEIMPLATTWVDLDIIILNEIRDRDIQISYYIPYIWNLKKNGYKWTYLKNRNRLRKLWLLRGRDRLGVYDKHVHTALFKMDNWQGPTV